MTKVQGEEGGAAGSMNEPTGGYSGKRKRGGAGSRGGSLNVGVVEY